MAITTVMIRRVLAALFIWTLALPLWAAGSIRIATIRTEEFDSVSSFAVTSFNVPAGVTGPVLAMCVSSVGTGVGITAATWNSQSLTQAVTRNDTSNTSEIWVLANPAANTTSNISITSDAGEIGAVTAFVMEGLANAGAAATNSAVSSGSSITGSITTTQANQFVIDCLTIGNSGDSPAPTQGGQTERSEFTPSFLLPVSNVSDKQGPVSPGSTSLGWDSFSVVSPAVQTLAAFSQPAASTAVKDMIGPGIIPGPR